MTSKMNRLAMQSGQESSSHKELILVCGAARSGTTMLDLMLGNADDAFSSGEIYALFRPFREHHFSPVCTCGSRDCAAWRDLRKVSERDFHARVLERPDVNFVIDSSKDLRWTLNSNRWARQHGYGVRNVLIWKDPIDLAHSHWKRGRPIDYFRKQFVDYYERFLELGLPFVSVSYKDLVEQPGEMLALLCNELGMNYFPGKEEFWYKKHHHFFGSAGTARQVGSGNSRVRLLRDFPEEFVRAYDEYLEHSRPDFKIDAIVEQLRGHDLLNVNRPPALDSKKSGLRPVWYYRHVLKALFRRYFPERTSIAD